MPNIKCKNCVAVNEVAQKETTFECDYCGSMQTMPRLTPNNTALYERAEQFRTCNNFDKATAVYEKILANNPQDPEVYWRLALCKYGVTYVEDPYSHERKPTVNCTQIISIFADENYLAAVKYADSAQKAIYEQEAQKIDKIGRGILEISRREAPFDVFICYKETDNLGQRTRDSADANDLYHVLCNEGFKVFFARITLEDKIGSAYEPYIFAALQSAKVMVVLGSDKAYFNAPWVRNEWSRYLAMIKQGENKTIIPVYKNMDPYDLPQEFSNLQALDIGKIGAVQDLVRGIKKIISAGQKTSAAEAPNANASNAGNAIVAKTKWAFICIEDGDYEKADLYLEEVLVSDPENGSAYLGKCLIEKGLNVVDDLLNLPNSIDLNQDKNIQRALRFGDSALQNKLKTIVETRKERFEEEQRKRREEARRIREQREREAQEQLEREARKQWEETEAARMRKEEEQLAYKKSLRNLAIFLLFFIILSIICFGIALGWWANLGQRMSSLDQEIKDTFHNIESGEFTDKRDNQSYKTVKIGSQIWMAENLRYAGVKQYSVNGNRKNDVEYGYLYEWKEAIQACPDGWHLPTKEEFSSLLSYVGSDSIGSKNLRATSWSNGSDKYGFSALPAGYYYPGSGYTGLGLYTYFWSRTDTVSSQNAYSLDMDTSKARIGGTNMTVAISVRCIQDN